MERSLEVRTGESIVIRYELAGLGSRFLAMFIDFTFQIAAAFVVVVGGLILASILGYSVARQLGTSVAIAALAVVLFLIFFGYFIIFETIWNGTTPGKHLIGIRVVRDGGFPLDFMGAVIRNVIRSLEFSLGFYAISAIVVLISNENKRLGDFAAGTIVVRDR